MTVNMPFRFAAAWGLVVAVMLAGLPAWAQGSGEPLRPPGRSLEPGEHCLDVLNESQFMMIVQLRNADRVQTTLRLEENEARRVCLQGALHPGDRVSLIIKNFLAIPIFDCRTQVNRVARIYSEPLDDGGTRTWAECH